MEVDANMNLIVRMSTLAKTEVDNGAADIAELFLDCSQQPGWFRIVGSDRVVLINDFLNRTYVVPFKSLQNLSDSKDQTSMIFPGHETTDAERERMGRKNEDR